MYIALYLKIPFCKELKKNRKKQRYVPQTARNHINHNTLWPFYVYFQFERQMALANILPSEHTYDDEMHALL